MALLHWGFLCLQGQVPVTFTGMCWGFFLSIWVFTKTPLKCISFSNYAVPFWLAIIQSAAWLFLPLWTDVRCTLCQPLCYICPVFLPFPISSVDGYVSGCSPLCLSIPHSSFLFFLLFLPLKCKLFVINVTSAFKSYLPQSYTQQHLQVCFPPCHHSSGDPVRKTHVFPPASTPHTLTFGQTPHTYPQLLMETAVLWFYICPLNLPSHTLMKKRAMSSHAYTWGVGFSVAPCTVTPVAGCLWHLTKLLFCHTHSKVSPHNDKFPSFFLLFKLTSFLKGTLVISWLLFNWDEGHLKQTWSLLLSS